MPGNSSPFVQSGQPLHEFLLSFWQRQIEAAEQEIPDYRHPPLPLARIKKVMKSDPDVKQMIAADAPILFCKACEIFIEEITSRAFIVADSNKRRTLSRSDISKALGKSDQFDFLIDIVPRDDQFSGAKSKKKAAVASGEVQASSASAQATKDGSQEILKEEAGDTIQDDSLALQATSSIGANTISPSAMMDPADHLQSILNMQPPM